MSRVRLVHLLVGALVLALLLALVGLTLAWRRADHEHALRQAGDDADRAARRVAVALTTYDYRKLGHAYDWVDQDGTTRFQSNFTSVSDNARASVIALKVVATGTVIASAPLVRDTGHVRVLLFVDQQVHSTNSQGTHTEQPRLSMQLVRQHGHWLVDSVDMENSIG